MAKNVKRGSKLLAAVLALVLVLGAVIGGTMAWLIDETDEVVNTFTYGDINIDLDETPTDDDDDNPNTNDYEMVPGQTITKDPVVTVKPGTVDMWLFVKLEKSDNFDDFMTYELAEGWLALDGEDGVYYRMVDAVDADTEFHVLKDDAVHVKGSVTKEMLNELTEDVANINYPKLTVTAYAVQRDNNINTAALAWQVAQNPTMDIPSP